jgi:hypothetical protein
MFARPEADCATWRETFTPNEKAARRGAAFYLHTRLGAGSASGENHVLCLQALRTRLHFEFHFGTLLQRPVTRSLDRAEVDENVFTRLPLNKAIAFRGIKPFDNTFFFHYFLSSFTQS